jgi:hypothetical protein
MKWIAVLVGACVLVACSSSSKTDSTVKTTHWSSSPDPTVAPTDPVTPPTIDRSASCISDASTMSSEISDTLGGIQDAAGRQDPLGAMAACSDAETKVEGWRQTTAEIPYASIKEPLTTALDDYESAFTQCSVGNFSEATTYTQLGTAKIGEATDAVTALTGG